MDIIEHPLTGEKLRIAKADFTDKMTWENAYAACNALGSGWRLPTREELNEMYKNRHTIGGFKTWYYWSSCEYNNDRAWYHEFCDDNQGNSTKYQRYYVRSVRSV